MKFYLARHAEAEVGPQMDPTRELTDRGREQAKVIGKFLVTQTKKIGLIVCSNLKRGIDTAETMAEYLDVDVERDFRVEPDQTPLAMWQCIQQWAKKLEDGEELLIVSHGPLINSFSAWLLNSGEGDKFHFSHATVCHFDTETPEDGRYGYDGRGEKVRAYLHWMATANMVNRLVEESPKAVVESLAGLADAALAVVEAALLEKTERPYTYEEVILKRWVLGDGGQSGNCEECEENAEAGWIDSEDVFPAVSQYGPVDDGPLHDHCTCTVEYKESRRRVYEAIRPAPTLHAT